MALPGFVCNLQFDFITDPPSNNWKETPWIKGLRLEYVAPDTVHFTEDLR